MSDVLDKALWLVSQESPTGQEEELCLQLLAWARQHFPDGRIERYRQGFLLEPAPPQAGRPTLALVGHLDTVPISPTQQLGLDGGRLYGCGASDMKSGVAVMMSLLEAHQRSDWNLVGLFYDQEEGPYLQNGLDPLLDQLRHPLPELAVVLEPTNNQIQAGCVGSIQARVHVQGRRAHSARPWQGENAIYKALPLLQRLAELKEKKVVHGGLEFYEVVTATQAFSSGPSNAVPGEFVLNLNQRFAPGKSPEVALEELRHLIGGEHELEVCDVAPSATVDLSHPRLVKWLQAARLRVEPKQAWTDVARLTQRGIAAFNFGPGDPAQAHQANEWIAITALDDCLDLLRQLLLPA